MRETHDQPDLDVGWADRNSVDTGRDAPGGPDRLPEAGRRAVVRDAPERTALSLEYMQKVKAVYAAYAAREPEVRDDRFSPPESPARRAARMSGEVELPARVRGPAWGAGSHAERRPGRPHVQWAWARPMRLSGARVPLCGMAWMVATEAGRAARPPQRARPR